MRRTLNNDSRSTALFEGHAALLRALLPASIPVAMCLIAAGWASQPETTRQSDFVSASELTRTLSRRLQSLQDLHPGSQCERVVLRISQNALSDVQGMVSESDLQFAGLLARCMKSMNLAVTICVAEPKQLAIAERLATEMIEVNGVPTDRIALSLRPDLAASAVAFQIIRSPADHPASEYP